jgi:aspartyl/asparaginyl beta-hydroxylase (cupin superfamily)
VTFAVEAPSNLIASELVPHGEWEIVDGRGYQTLDVSHLFPPPFKRAFYLKLPPGTQLHKHRDAGDVQTDHIVIQTNPNCLNFWIDEEGNEQFLHMEQGKRYTVDRTLMHWAVNDGETDRIHLLLEY